MPPTVQTLVKRFATVRLVLCRRGCNENFSSCFMQWFEIKPISDLHNVSTFTLQIMTVKLKFKLPREERGKFLSDLILQTYSVTVGKFEDQKNKLHFSFEAQRNFLYKCCSQKIMHDSRKIVRSSFNSEFHAKLAERFRLNAVSKHKA